MKKFKKIYIEITNNCNLNCSFCSIDKLEKRFMTLNQFEHILTKINDYTDYIYLHVKGEPLLHPELDKIIDLCEKYKKQVNITTNGTLLKLRKDILKNNCIRQINISLHSENKKQNYLEEIFETTNELQNKIIVFRFWTMDNNQLNEKSTEIVNKITDFYKISTETVEKIKTDNHIKIRDNLYIDKANEFIWPSLDNDYYCEFGYCQALKTHIAILVDGTVIPCCLDSSGVINLGNIYKENLVDILNKDIVKTMINDFCNRKVTTELCKHCSYKERFDK